MKNYTLTGLIAGLAIAFAILNYNVLGFLAVVLFGAIGAIIGLHFDGRIDLTAIFSGRKG